MKLNGSVANLTNGYNHIDVSSSSVAITGGGHTLLVNSSGASIDGRKL